MAGSKSYPKGSTPFRNADPIALARALAADKINVRGTGRREVAKPPRSAEEADRTPDWDMWRWIPTAELWQCVALSLNIDPEKVRGRIKRYGDFGSEESDEFNTRLRIAVAQDDATLQRLAIVMDAPNRATLNIRQFAAWMREIRRVAPAELLAMADKRPEDVNWNYWGALDLWPLDAACKLISGDNPKEPTRPGI